MAKISGAVAACMLWMCGDNIMEIAIKNKALAKEILARSGVI